MEAKDMIKYISMLLRKNLKSKTKGATIMEYTLLLCALSIVCVGGFRRIGGGYLKMYNNISDALSIVYEKK